MSRRASQWPCPQPPTTATTRWRLVKRTTAYGHGRRTGPRRLRTKLYGDRCHEQAGSRSSSSCWRKSPAGCGPGFSPVQRHTMEHIVDFVCFAPMVQILDAPVPQMVEQLPDVLQFFDTLTTEQIIEVAKIFPEDVPMRTSLRDTQLAKQLVEVPTLVSPSLPVDVLEEDSLRLIMEQNVDIPVPGRGGRIAGLQGFLPRQSSTTLHVSQERISGRIVEQIVNFPVSGGGLQDFSPKTEFILFFAPSSSCS